MTDPRALRGTRKLHVAVVGAHLALLVLVAAAAATAALPAAWRAAVAAAAAGPLLLGLPGLRRGSRRTCQWTALLLVLYIGAAIVEVVAAGGRTMPALVLFAALCELALLMLFSRHPAPRALRE